MKLEIDKFVKGTVYLLNENGDVLGEQPCELEIKLGAFKIEIDLQGDVTFPAVAGGPVTRVAYKYHATNAHCATQEISIYANGGDITLTLTE